MGNLFLISVHDFHKAHIDLKKLENVILYKELLSEPGKNRVTFEILAADRPNVSDVFVKLINAMGRMEYCPESVKNDKATMLSTSQNYEEKKKKTGDY